MKYLKGKQTKITKVILKAQKTESYIRGEQQIELMLYSNEDLEDVVLANYFLGDYIDIENLGNQVKTLVKKYKLSSVHLKVPSEQYGFDQLLIWGA